MVMRTSRRQFLETASRAGVLLPMSRLVSGVKGDLSPNAPVQELQNDSHVSSAPTKVFDGTSLSGWHVQGSGKWRVEDAVIVGSSDAGGSGWLVLDRGLEDFVLKFSFRASGGEAGVLLRNAPLS